jgi:hypothetical protein
MQIPNLEVTTYIGSENYSFSPEDDKKPKGKKYFLGTFDFGSSPSGGDIRHYYLSTSDSRCTLWDVMTDGDINNGKPMYAQVADCKDYKGRKNINVACKLLLESLKAEKNGFDLESKTIKIIQEGLINKNDLSQIIYALNKRTLHCVDEKYQYFKKNMNRHIRLDEDYLLFAYEALSEINFADVTSIDFPMLKKQTLVDWALFEFWCEDVSRGLFEELADKGGDIFSEALRNTTPRTYFGTTARLKSEIVEIIKNKDDPDKLTPFVEIENNGETLFLVYTGSTDGWSLGHCDSVIIVNDIGDLNKKLGYY